MSIAARRVLMNTIATGLGDMLTTNQVTSVLGVMSSCLDGYQVEAIERTGTEPLSDELLDAFLAAKEIEGRSPKTIARFL